MQFEWFQKGDSHFCIQLNQNNLLPEWHVLGQVQLRQVYATVKPKFYAIVTDSDHEGEQTIVARTYGLDEAKAAVERALT